MRASAALEASKRLSQIMTHSESLVRETPVYFKMCRLLSPRKHIQEDILTFIDKLSHLKLLLGLLKDPKICPCWELSPTAVTSSLP